MVTDRVVASLTDTLTCYFKWSFHCCCPMEKVEIKINKDSGTAQRDCVYGRRSNLYFVKARVLGMSSKCSYNIVYNA